MAIMPSTESLRRALAVGVPGMSRRYSWRLAVAVAYAADDDEDDGGRGAGGPLAFVGVVEEAEDKTDDASFSNGSLPTAEFAALVPADRLVLLESTESVSSLSEDTTEVVRLLVEEPISASARAGFKKLSRCCKFVSAVMLASAEDEEDEEETEGEAAGVLLPPVLLRLRPLNSQKTEDSHLPKPGAPLLGAGRRGILLVPENCSASAEKFARLRTTRQRDRVPCTSNASAEDAEDAEEEGVALPTMRTAKILLNSSWAVMLPGEGAP